MKIKKEYIILAVIIIVLSGYLAIHKSDKIHYQLPTLGKVAQKNVTSIEMVKNDEQIILNKKGNNWVIGPNEYPADDKKIKDMLDIIDGLTLTALVSESENYVRYDLNKEKRIHVRVLKSDELKRELFIGKTAPSFNHTFVRIQSDPKVYHAKENFRSTFDQTVEALRDKIVLALEQNEIQEIRIAKGEKKIDFLKKQVPVEVKTDKKTKDGKKETPPSVAQVWQDGSGKEVEDSKITTFLSTLKNLHCKKYLEGKTRDDLKDPIFTVHLKGVEDHSLSIFEKSQEKDEEYPAISSQNKYSFVLDSSTADTILSAFDEKKEEEKKTSQE